MLCFIQNPWKLNAEVLQGVPKNIIIYNLTCYLQNIHLVITREPWSRMGKLLPKDGY